VISLTDLLEKNLKRCPFIFIEFQIKTNYASSIQKGDFLKIPEISPDLIQVFNSPAP
jgi:hypothetical protein